MNSFSILQQTNVLTIHGDMVKPDIHLFNHLSADDILTLKLNSRKRLFQKQSIIYKEGSKHTEVYFILEGIIKLYKAGNGGKQHIIRFAKKGDIIGYRSAITNEPACTTAEVNKEAVAYQIPKEDFINLLKQNRSFSIDIMKKVCRELRESNGYIADIAQKSVRKLTAKALLRLKDEFGLDSHNTLQLTISRDELANMVGTAYENLIRVMTDFKKEHLLEFPCRKIVYLDIPRLHHIANLE